MKKLFTLVVFFCGINILNAQALLIEDFNYTSGQPLTSNGWIQNGTTATNPISVTTSGLTFTGYSGSAIGNAAQLISFGQDIYRDPVPAAPITSGNAYVSFLINVDTVKTGDYFFALLPSTSTSLYTGRVFVKTSGAGFVIGVSKSSESPVYGATVFNLNTTYLVVLKYNFATGTSLDDHNSLFVFDSGIPTTEPATPLAVDTATTKADATEIGRIALRQGSVASACAIKIDGIRFATSWVNAPLPLALKSFNASLVNNSASLVWNTTNENNVDGFTIERSNDGNTYTNIGFVAAKNTASNTYTFNDLLQIKNATYYRLKITDKDGSFKYSSVIVMNAKSGIKLDVYPNPAANTLVVTHPKSSVNSVVKIINIDGKNMLTQNIQNGATQSTIDVSKLIKGNYLVVLENDGARSATQFVKQ